MMSNLQVFLLQMALTVLVYALIAKWYIARALEGLPRNTILGYLLLPHALRHIGLTAVVPMFVEPTVPMLWSYRVGYGDLLTQVLATLTILALRGQWAFAIAMVWITNVVGLADFVNAGIQATMLGFTPPYTKLTDYKLGGF